MVIYVTAPCFMVWAKKNKIGEINQSKLFIPFTSPGGGEILTYTVTARLILDETQSAESFPAWSLSYVRFHNRMIAEYFLHPSCFHPLRCQSVNQFISKLKEPFRHFPGGGVFKLSLLYCHFRINGCYVSASVSCVSSSVFISAHNLSVFVEVS